MSSLSEASRREALLKIALLCKLRSEARYSEEEIAEKLGFGSVEAFRIQLGHWQLPEWIGSGGHTAREKVAQEKRQPSRRGRSSGQAEEIPSGQAAAQLFDDAVGVLARAAEQLENLTQVSQGGRIVNTYVYTDPVYFSRESFSEEQWRKLCELHDHDPDAEGFLAHGLTTKTPAGASPTPSRSLVLLIAAYALADRPLELLVEALHPNASEADWDKIRSLSYARKRKGGPNRDGLLRTAEQLATAVCGGTVGRGAPPPDVSPMEQALAYRITERREAGVPDETIYDDMRHVGLTKQELTWEEFQRLGNLRLRYPET
jgi:hypothetical protein